MSKPTPPKLNLQIRSASFKDTNHAGTVTQNKTSMQLLKDRWKSEDSAGTSKNFNESLNNKTEKLKKEVLAKSVKNQVIVQKKSVSVESTSVTGKHSLPNKLSGVKKESNEVKPVSKSKANGEIVSDSGLNLVVSEDKNRIKKDEKKDGDKVLGTRIKSTVNTKQEIEMKTESKNSPASEKTSVNSKADAGKVSVNSSDNSSRTSCSSMDEICQKNVDQDKTKVIINVETQSESSLVINDTSQKNYATEQQAVKVPCDVTTANLDLKQTGNNKSSTVLSEIKLIQNGWQNNKDNKVSKDRETKSETDNIEKNKGNEDPETIIEELESYLRKRFGPIVDETYTQVGETEKIKEDKSVVELEPATCLSFSSESGSDKTSEASTPLSPTVDKRAETFIPHPIFFKTSIKKDPGSKLHDALVTELSSVLKKRDDPKGTAIENGKDDSDLDKLKIPKKRISAKGNKVLGNKALLATLEDHLTRTLHKNKIFQRQSLKVLGLDTIEIGQENKTGESKQDLSVTNISNGNIPVAPPPPAIPHYGAVPLHITPKVNKTVDKGTDKSAESNSKVTEKSHKKESDNKAVAKEPKEILNHIIDTDKNESELDKSDEILIYTYEHPSGRTEGVVCSVETKENGDNSGKSRKYITCVNIVAENSGCPFIQSVDDGGMPTASGAGLYLAEVDKPAIFTIDCGRQKGDLGVNVKGSNNVPIRNSVNQQADGTFIVTYIPVDCGYCDIDVTWKGQDIPGSPYNPKVVDSRRVRIIGGWQHFMDSNERINLTVGELKQLPFDIADAGPGVLRAEVSGPSGNIDADIDTYTPGKNIIEFTPQEEGNHYIHIFWSDYALMNSPFLGYAVPQHVDASKIILTGRGLREAVVREEADFMIDGSQAGQGTPEVTLTGIKAEVNVRIVSVGNGRFKCSYIPVVPGAYLLHINWNGRQLRGSPYKVNVIGAFYPNKVIVSGEGIHGGLLGREIDVRIDTRKAGPGELTAYCMGPRQVAVCELTDNHDGTFRLGIRPKEPGRHVLQVKYGGEHVQGSPFVIKVTAQPDASKVRVVGPGVEHGILATFVSRFIVETKGAGAGQLTVRIRGPKGGFQVEMYRDSQRDRTILCRYDPTECGLYIISVKWSGMDVPGSPFHVHILDTQEELEQVLNEVSYSVKTGGSHGGSQHSQHGIPQPVPQRLAYSQWREAI